MRDRLRAIVAQTLAHDPAHDIGHFDRVWHNAQIIAKDTDADRDVLLAASYLHDLVNLPKDDPHRAQASRMSAKAALPYLQSLGLSDAQISGVQHAITAHSFSAGVAPQTTEAQILQDADRIDALGAIGLARCIAVSAALGRQLFDPVDPFAAHRPLDDRQFAIDHFQTKLLRLPDTMQTAQGAALARERARVLETFLQDLAAELPPQPA